MTARAVHHLAFRTHDLDGLAAFYRDVVGLAPREGGTPGRSVWFELGEGIVMIERAEPGEPGVAQGTLELVGFTVRPEEMPATRARLETQGIALEGATRFSLYFRDPEGRRLAFSHYPSEPIDARS